MPRYQGTKRSGTGLHRLFIGSSFVYKDFQKRQWSLFIHPHVFIDEINAPDRMREEHLLALFLNALCPKNAQTTAQLHSSYTLVK